MDEQMMKGLQDLIDETIAEVEELKKSKFAASEIKIEGPGDGIAGKPTNGSLAEKADDEEKDEEKSDDDSDDKDDDKKKKFEEYQKAEDDYKKKKADYDDACKAEGTNRQSDPNGGNHQAIAKEEAEKAEGTNRQSDPNGGNHQPIAKEDAEKNDSPGTGNANPLMQTEGMNKSEDDLVKSYIDSRLAPLESKIESILAAVQDIGDAPVAAKGQNFKNVQPLAKNDDVEPLNSSELADKLLELKKNGTEVNSTDIASVELGGPADLVKIAERYNLN